MQITSMKAKGALLFKRRYPSRGVELASLERNVLHELTPVPLSALSVGNERRQKLL